ncbi:MAG: tRNA (guanosine(37)-N1)-methyltransferase TrmD [Omnitrophica bacterium RIFCSPHIGHO2_02_FULL_51_18]|nr:MAG: tRNA (guanosine(37)-N1)-methyltransferase TrmD [Omnitrophica bacterium RIFCSPHIGHO2_02_FULL_51_18]
MKIDILTLFPGMFDSFFSHSILKRAIEKKKISVGVHNLRDFTHDRHKTCDDKPFGGGPGMLMKPEPIFEAYDKLFGKKAKKRASGFRFIYMTPQGAPFMQSTARKLSKARHLAVLCGHYEGVDQRVIDKLVTDEISIGDYVLTGGEIPAMVVVDAVARLVPGVLGREESKEFESFCRNLLEYPQYTRPSIYRGLKVPSILLSGHHKEIELWRREAALKITKKRRPELLRKGERNASGDQAVGAGTGQKGHPGF